MSPATQLLIAGFRSQPLSFRYILLLFALNCSTCSTAVCTAKIQLVSSAVFVRILAAVFPRDLFHPCLQSSKTSALPPSKWQDLCLQCRERPNARASFSRALDPLFCISPPPPSYDSAAPVQYTPVCVHKRRNYVSTQLCLRVRFFFEGCFELFDSRVILIIFYDVILLPASINNTNVTTAHLIGGRGCGANTVWRSWDSGYVEWSRVTSPPWQAFLRREQRQRRRS